MIATGGDFFEQNVDTTKEDAPASARGRIADFGVLFWLENVSIFFTVSILYTSANFFPYYLASERGMSLELAGQCASLIYWCVGIAPLAGALADRVGHRLTIQIFAIATALLSFLLLYAAPSFDPWFLVSLVGISFAFLEQNSYTLLARTFPSEDLEATGFGIMGLFLNAGLILISPLLRKVDATIGNFGNQTRCTSHLSPAVCSLPFLFAIFIRKERPWIKALGNLQLCTSLNLALSLPKFENQHKAAALSLSRVISNNVV